MIDLESLLNYERVIQNTRYPLYIPIRDDEGKIIKTELEGKSYQWIHKLMDVKDGKPVYTTGILEEVEP